MLGRAHSIITSVWAWTHLMDVLIICFWFIEVQVIKSKTKMTNRIKTKNVICWYDQETIMFAAKCGIIFGLWRNAAAGVKMVLHYNSTISELSEMPEIIELPNKAEEINKKKFNNSKVGNKNSNIFWDNDSKNTGSLKSWTGFIL